MAAYKSLIDPDGTWWTIFKGDDIPEADLRAAADYISGGGPLIVETWHLHLMPRVKWCGRYGWACDNEGEWHMHWFEVQPGEDTAHTLVRAAS